MNIPSGRTGYLAMPAVIALTLALAACANTPSSQVQDLATRVQNARTSADHGELAATYEREAQEALSLSKLHRQTGRLYATYPGKGYGSAMANHCEQLAAKYAEIAAEKSAMAKAHRDLAASAPQER